MRFKTELRDIRTLARIVSSISSLEKIAWVRLDDDMVRFTVIPDVGSQVWASISMDLIFANTSLQSAAEHNVINLEIPLVPLLRALKSAIGSTSASLRLTKKDGAPVLTLTITTAMLTHSASSVSANVNVATANAAAGGLAATDAAGLHAAYGGNPPPLTTTQHAAAARHKGAPPPIPPSSTADTEAYGYAYDAYTYGSNSSKTLPGAGVEVSLRREREKVITQNIPVRVLHPDTVATVMQPKVREADVNINLPSLVQLKAMSDRFTRLAAASSLVPVDTAAQQNGSQLQGGMTGAGRGGAGIAGRAGPGADALADTGGSAKLILSANMHGSLSLSISTPSLAISSTWTGLEHPILDESQLDMPLSQHPSEVFRRAGPERWATVLVDGKDWSRVLSVGRLNAERVVACFSDAHALILYVYLGLEAGEGGMAQGDDDRGGELSCLTRMRHRLWSFK